jgi:acylphosphatase
MVSGKVQGVFFRASTKKQADRLSLCGWVHNCENGNVQGCASGTSAAVEQFVLWLQRGPLLAKVDSLTVEDCKHQAFNSFDVR